MTLADAAMRLGKSERTVRRLMEEGKVKGRKVKGRWVIDDLGEEELSAPDGTMQALIIQLRSENEYLREENQDLRQQLEDSRKRQDTIILQMTDSRRLLEDLRQPFWRRWRRRRAEKAGDPQAGVVQE